MRVLQVVTYMSSDGSFGGPVAVATSQAEALARRGDDVELFSGWDGTLDVEVEGCHVTLERVRSVFPGLGFSGLASRTLRERVQKAVARADVVHVHYGRDLVSALAANAAIRQGKPLVLQTHGMVRNDSRLRVRLFDRLLSRQAHRRADRVLFLTDREAEELRDTGVASGALTAITNGVALPTEEYERPRGGNTDVLFLARLHPRKQAQVFVRAAAVLANQFPDARFSIVGPDEGDLASTLTLIESLGLSDRVRYEGSLPPSAVRARLAAATMYVLPSVGEVVPMTVLDALGVGTPVVLSDDCGLADDLGRRGAVVVSHPDPDGVAHAVRGLLEDARSQGEVVRRGREALEATYSSDAVAERLAGIYRDLSGGLSGTPRASDSRPADA